MTTLAIPTSAAQVEGPPQGQWTRADWETLPADGSRYEIINGVLYMSTAPSLFHQWIIGQLHLRLGAPVMQQGLGYAFFAPVGVFMPNCDPVQPDFVIVLMANKSILHDRHINGVPDLVFEVLSPGSTAYDEGIKLDAYERAGVPEYAIIDPSPRELRYYQLDQNGQYAAPVSYSAADTLTFVCLPGIALTVGDLFAGAPDTTV